eukprot:3847651-Prymnesium_polylepis.1
MVGHMRGVAHAGVQRGHMRGCSGRLESCRRRVSLGAPRVAELPLGHPRRERLLDGLRVHFEPA